MIRNEKLFWIIIICLSLLILFPKNINTLFYYDDNPIRFMVAKRLASGNIDKIDEFISFFSFGSAEIYIPFFLFSKIFNIQNDDLVYNLASLSYFVLSCIMLVFYFDKNKKIIQKGNTYDYSGYITSVGYILVIFCLLGISAVAGGHIHWLISCSLFTIVASKIYFSQKINASDYIILGIAHFISPPLAIFSIIFSLIERRIDIFLIPLIINLVKFFSYYIILIKYLKIFLSLEISQQNFTIEDKFFLPPDFGIILRFLSFDYFRLSFIFAPLIYIIVFRSIFTAKKTFIVLAFIYYSVVLFALIILKLSEEKTKILKTIIFIFSAHIFTLNPVRFVPLFLIFSLLHIRKVKFDDYFKVIALVFFLARALLSFFGFGPLPQKIPGSVNSVIEYILNNTKREDKILVEGDKHIFEKGRLVHPLYNSHILPYIIAKIENRNFVGTGTPWEPFYSPFIAGRFKEVPIDKSEILSFISENDIKYVLCWTQECENFFRNLGKKIVVIDKFKIIHIKGNQY